MFSALIAGGLLAAVAAVVGTGVNAYMQNKTNETNKEINQQQLDYNAAMTQQSWERDDNAHQREVADLEAAGLSPIAASGSGAMNSSPLGAPSPIAMQAPQIDINALTQSLLGYENVKEIKRHNQAVEKYESGKLENEATELELRAQQLDIENKKVEEQIKYNAKVLKLQAEELDEKIRSNKKGEELRLSETEQRYFEAESQQVIKEIQRQSGGTDVPTNVFHDFEIYTVHYKLWLSKFNRLIQTLQETRKASGSSESRNGGFGLGVSVPGQPFTGNTNVSGGQSDSLHSYSDISKKQEAMLFAFYKENPIPVYINKNDYKHYYK